MAVVACAAFGFAWVSGLLGCGSADSSTEKVVEPSREARPHWEAVVLAEASNAEASAEGDTLRLDGVDPVVATFTDRPDRLAGELTVDELLALWSRGAFRDDPPNALVVTGGTVAAVELSGVVWDPELQQLWFSVDPLDDEAVGKDPMGKGGPLRPFGQERAGATQLFIDAFATPLDPQMTDSVTQTNVKILGTSPADSMGVLYQNMADSISLANSTRGAGNGSLYDTDTASTRAAIQDILNGGDGGGS